MKIINQSDFQVMQRLTSNLILTIFIFTIISCQSAQNQEKIKVTVDPRIELVSTVCRLAGYDEYNMGSYPTYHRIVWEYFKPFENHRAVQVAKKIRKTNNIAYNAPISLATYLVDIESMETKIPFSPLPGDLDERWDQESAADFISALKEFREDSDFKSFLGQNQSIYDIAIERFEKIVGKHDITVWFEDYFGTKQKNQFSIFLGLQNGGANYASSATTSNGGKQIFSTIGCWAQDENGYPDFDENIIATVVHEFCHSYINPIVDQFEKDLEDPGTRVFYIVEEEMTSMAYTTWQTMMNETFVRACVIRFIANTIGQDAASEQTKKEVEKGFTWVDDLATFLKEYEADRDLFTRFDLYVPKIAEFFNQNMGKIQSEIGNKGVQTDWIKMKTEGPQIIEILPANGSESVDPGTTEIRIKFDRKMANSYSVMKRTFENYPEIRGSVRFEEDNTLFIIPVKLKANWNYYMELNHFKSSNFKDESGKPLYPVIYKFSTGN